MKTSWDIHEALKSHAFSPRLAYLLLQILPKEQLVIDYGCGLGMYVAFLRARGYTALGIEGTESINDFGMVQDILVTDLSEPLPMEIFNNLSPGSSLCLEVGEHIDPAREDIFLENITKFCHGRLVLSWALPGQGGHGHVNERTNRYIESKMRERNFELNVAATDYLTSSMVGDPAWWFCNTLMVYDRKISR